MSIKLSKHCEQRINQRGFRKSNLELIRRCGTPIHDPENEVYLMRDKDVDHYVCLLKYEIKEIERLRGCKAVFAGNTSVTIVRVGHSHEKKLLRRVPTLGSDRNGARR